MPTFRKYSFQLQADYEALLTPSGNAVVLGDIDGYFCVDVLWADEPDTRYLNYTVWPEPLGAHTYAGWDEQYTLDFNKYKP